MMLGQENLAMLQPGPRARTKTFGGGLTPRASKGKSFSSSQKQSFSIKSFGEVTPAGKKGMGSVRCVAILH
jgi:hypothetical protein